MYAIMREIPFNQRQEKLTLQSIAPTMRCVLSGDHCISNTSLSEGRSQIRSKGAISATVNQLDGSGTVEYEQKHI